MFSIYMGTHATSYKGLPNLRVANGKLIPLENYQDQLCNIVADASKFAKVRRNISGKAFIEGLQHDLFIQHQIRHLFLNKPTFQTYTELDERFQSIPDRLPPVLGEAPKMLLDRLVSFHHFQRVLS